VRPKKVVKPVESLKFVSDFPQHPYAAILIVKLVFNDSMTPFYGSIVLRTPRSKNVKRYFEFFTRSFK
jgi:hypothetical protein